MLRHNEVYRAYGSSRELSRQFRIAPPSLLYMTTADLVSLYKFLSVNATSPFGGVALMDTRKASDQEDEDREVHEQAAQAHE
jgi:hypothetical protein